MYFKRLFPHLFLTWTRFHGYSMKRNKVSWSQTPSHISNVPPSKKNLLFSMTLGNGKSCTFQLKISWALPIPIAFFQFKCFLCWKAPLSTKGGLNGLFRQTFSLLGFPFLPQNDGWIWKRVCLWCWWKKVIIVRVFWCLLGPIRLPGPTSGSSAGISYESASGATCGPFSLVWPHPGSSWYCLSPRELPVSCLDTAVLGCKTTSTLQ